MLLLLVLSHAFSSSSTLSRALLQLHILNSDHLRVRSVSLRHAMPTEATRSENTNTERIAPFASRQPNHRRPINRPIPGALILMRVMVILTLSIGIVGFNPSRRQWPLFHAVGLCWSAPLGAI